MKGGEFLISRVTVILRTFLYHGVGSDLLNENYLSFLFLIKLYPRDRHRLIFYVSVYMLEIICNLFTFYICHIYTV